MKFKLLLVGLFASQVAVAATTWDMPTPYPENNFHTQNILQFAQEIEQATGGELKIKVHSAGSLIKHTEIKNAVRSGQVPIGEFLISQLANEDPLFQADSIPFLATSYEASMKLWQASRPEVEKLLDKQGLMVLYAVAWPPQGVYANKPLNSVDDLKGLKFRAYNTATERLAQLAGAVPTQVEAADLAQAFATGRVESMITSPSTGANSKAWDYVSHYYHVQAWLPKNLVIVNKRAFQRLPEAQRKAVLEAAAKAESRGWEMSRKETEEKLAELKANGMKVEPPSEALMAGLRKIGETMTAEWVKAAGVTGEAVLKAYRQ
ncbi:MAG TPA: TRAP transporter substrate-binding protein [Candidatus Competibacteraceae bacterium]|nr:TRAP transporter substrate-binding protein [Candidatus Competibacteraceae bacterium]